MATRFIVIQSDRGTQRGEFTSFGAAFDAARDLADHFGRLMLVMEESPGGGWKLRADVKPRTHGEAAMRARLPPGARNPRRRKNPDVPRAAATLLQAIRPGDRVTIVDRFGKERTGRAVMVFPTHVTLNMGGAHGTPAVATDANITRVVPGKGKGGGFVFRNPHRLTKAERRQGAALVRRYGKSRARRVAGAGIAHAQSRAQREHFVGVRKAVNPRARRNPAKLTVISVRSGASAPWRPFAASHSWVNAKWLGQLVRRNSNFDVLVSDKE